MSPEDYVKSLVDGAKVRRWFENRELVDKLAAHFGHRWGHDPISWRELFTAQESLGYPLTESERALKDYRP